jgi:hypothetical protein
MRVTIGFCQSLAALQLREIGLRDLLLAAALVGKSAERYCVPTSGPCALSWVGSATTEK